MLLTVKIKNYKYIERKKYYNNIAVDKRGTEIFFKTSQKLEKNSYYYIDVKLFKSDFQVKYSDNINIVSIKVIELNSIYKLNVVNNKLMFNNNVAKCYSYNFNSIELKLINEYEYLYYLCEAQKGCDNAKQYNINDDEIWRTEERIKKLKNKLKSIDLL